MRKRRSAALAATLALALVCRGVAAAEDRCFAGAGWGPFARLEHVGQALASRRGLLVVALGSSSTQGVGATAPERSYPARLETVLRARFPGTAVRVVNRGIGGETAADNLARLGRDVLAFRPDLVVWQVGTNDALRGLSPDLVASEVREGVAAIRGVGAEVALMAPQSLPDLERDGRVRRMGESLRAAARQAGASYLDRYALMRRWAEAGTWAPAELLGPDGLHMTDASYACLALRVADLLPAAAGPVLVARFGPATIP